MKVILLQDVKALGKKGEIVKVNEKIVSIVMSIKN